MQRQERGAQLVELALVLPLLLLIVLIATEGAALIRTYQVMVNAAREGARVAVLQENQAKVDETVNNASICYMVRDGVVPSASLPAMCAGVDTSSPACTVFSATVNSDYSIPNGATTMAAVQVNVSCTYRLKLLPSFGIANTIPLQTTATWRRLWN